jgi:hypothetical protein
VWPNSTIILKFDLNKSSITKLFNIQQCFNHKLKDYETNLMHPYSSKAFQWHQEHGKTCHDHVVVWELSTKQMKQANYLCR